jgi:hypothetical protein
MWVNELASKVKRLVPNPEEQAALAVMRDLRGKGASLREIAAAVG